MTFALLPSRREFVHFEVLLSNKLGFVSGEHQAPRVGTRRGDVSPAQIHCQLAVNVLRVLSIISGTTVRLWLVRMTRL
jgi:hypothetical protein